MKRRTRRRRMKRTKRRSPAMAGAALEASERGANHCVYNMGWMEWGIRMYCSYPSDVNQHNCIMIHKCGR